MAIDDARPLQQVKFVNKGTLIEGREGHTL